MRPIMIHIAIVITAQFCRQISYTFPAPDVIEVLAAGADLQQLVCKPVIPGLGP
jgi:hypothetical protein